MVSKYENYALITIMVLSVLYLIISMIYFFGIEKEDHDDEIYVGISMMVWGLIGVFGVWYGLYLGKISTYTYYASIAYILTPIVWGAYLLGKHWSKKN